MENMRTRIRRTSWWQKGLLLLGLVALLYTAIGFSLAPVVVERLLEDGIGHALGHRASIRDVEINPYRLTIRVKGLTLRELEGSTVTASLGEGLVDLDAATLTRWHPVVEALVLREPFVQLVRREDRTFRFSLPASSRDEADSEVGGPIRFEIRDVEVSGGHVRFVDRAAGREHELKDFHLSVPSISNTEEQAWVTTSLSARINESGVSVSGRARPFSEHPRARIRVSLEGVDLSKYTAYGPFVQGFEMASGRADLDGEISYGTSRENEPDMGITADLRVSSIVIERSGGRALAAPALQAAVRMKPFQRTVTVDSAVLRRPEVTLRREASGELDVPARSGDSGGTGGEWTFRLDQASVEEGRLRFEDLQKGTDFVLDPFDLQVRDLSNRPGSSAAYAFAAKNEAGLGVEAEGTFKPGAVSSEGTLAVSGVSLGRLRPYVPESVPVEAVEGVLGVHGRYRAAYGDAGWRLELSGVTCSLEAFRAAVGEPKEEVHIQDLQMQGGRLHWPDRRVEIDSLQTRGGSVAVSRGEDAVWSLKALAPQGGGEGEENRKEASPWSFSLHQAVLEDYAILLEDRYLPEPVTFRLKNVRSELSDVTVGEKAAASVMVRCGLERGGSVEASGTVDWKPLAADLTLHADGVPLPVFQPYLRHPDLELASAGLSADGELVLDMESGDPVLSYAGRAGVSRFSLKKKADGREILGWKRTEMSGLELGTAPPRCHMDTLEVHGAEAVVTITEQGRLNLIQALSRDDGEGRQEARADRQEEKTRPSVRVGQVLVRDGRIDFSDRHIQPPVRAELARLQGTIGRFSTSMDRPAEVDLHGRVSGNAPLDITGEVGTLSGGIYVDVGLELRGVSMVHLNPYAKRYVGYGVEKGNMTLDLEYLIDRRRLDSRNEVLLDQLTLGEKVQSAAAVDLPVRFAVAMLKDRQGEIRLSIPIQGDLDEPRTDLGEVVRKAVLGFFEKVISAPFSFLGSLFGGGEDLRHITFPYGSSSLTPKAEDKLQDLVQALEERPRLRVSITGHVDPVQDARALAEQEVQASLVFESKASAGEPGRAVMDALILRVFRKRFCAKEEGSEGLEPEEIRRLLEAGSAHPREERSGTQGAESQAAGLQSRFDETFCDPTIDPGAVFPTRLMKDLLREHAPVQEDALRRLARKRARAVHRFLSDAPDIGSERLFLAEASRLAPEGDVDVKQSRVRLGLETR